MRRLVPLAVSAALLSAVAFFTTQLHSESQSQHDWEHFESAHVHPAALSPSGDRLFVVNTPDMRLSVFSLAGGTPVLEKEIPVGLEPVSVAALDDDEAWVVNHRSRSVSVVRVGAGNVVRTLQAGFEPSDIVFAGRGANRRAFVAISGEDAVRIFDPANLDAAPETLPIDGSNPWGLARNADSSQVYLTILESGNQTAVVPFQAVQAGGGLPPPTPTMDGSLPPAPNVGLIVKWDGAAWRDEIGGNWNAAMPFNVTDRDLFLIDADARTVTGWADAVGTVNFVPAYNPANGRVYVTNVDARNEVRFEPNLKGNFLRNRVTVVDPSGGTVLDRVHLNPHIDYATVPGSQSEIDQSLALPGDLAWDADGDSGYVAAFGSAQLGVLDAAGSVVNRIAVGGGPSGVVYDADRNRVYVVNRFDNTISVVDVAAQSQVDVVPIGRSGFDPTPEEIVRGRRIQYDAPLTSGHGDVSCGSCHIFSNLDGIAWDLGDPRGSYMETTDPDFPPGQLDPFLEGFHPMKGPMLTQTLRGLDDILFLHWRADRLNLSKFNPAFVGLLGNDRELDAGELSDYTAFVMSIRNPANPNQNLDRTFPDAPPGQPSALRGFQTFVSDPHDGGLTCEQCHSLPTGTNEQIINDQALQEDQDIKVPHLRNLFERVGFDDSPGAVNHKRSGGFIHDGTVATLEDFLDLPVFQFSSEDQQRDMEAYLEAFDTGTAPAVGFQVTVTGDNENDPGLIALLDTLRFQVLDNHIDLVVKGVWNGEQRGWAYNGDFDYFVSDRASEPTLSRTEMRLLAENGGELTWTGVPDASAARAGVDRDRDGHYDRDELDFGTDPADPNSYPGAVAVGPAPRPALRFGGAAPNPFRGATSLAFTLPSKGPVRLELYDVRGRKLRTLVDAPLAAGEHRVRFDGRDGNGARLGAGVYFARLTYRNENARRPVVLLP